MYIESGANRCLTRMFFSVLLSLKDEKCTNLSLAY